MGFNPLSRLLQRLSDDADSDPVADGGAVAADQQDADPSDTQTPPSPSVEGKAESDEQTVVDVDLPTGEEARLVVDAPVSPDAIGDVVEAKGGSVSRGVQGQADDGTVIPVSTQDEDLDLSDTYFDSEQFDFDFIQDDRIQDVRDKQIDYNQRVGRYIMHKDDLVPSIKERIKGLIMGEDGLQVEPDDPDDDSDQQLADHLQEVYDGSSDVAPHVDPATVIDDILDQNFMNARWVGRAIDLRYLDLESLELVIDGESGDRVFVQEATSYTTFDVDEQDEDDAIDFDTETSDPQALEVGEDVLEARLYDRPPLEAVADDVVGKMEMKFLKARKAQIGSVGGLFIRVTPPDYLPEDEYFDRTSNPFTDDPDDTITKLEKELQQGIDRAFDTLQDYKSGTVMAIPNNWEVDQIDLPDSPQPLDDQIRGYNQSIARRLLYPLDLVELKSGAELSRETLFRTVINTLQGWREEILTVFDDFAEVQKEIHDLQGDVTHSFPAFANEDEELLVTALKYAGPAGMTEKEVRQTLNSLEGFDLDTDRDTQDMPPAGGPQKPQQRQDSMDDMLPDQEPGQTPQDGSETDGQQQDGTTSGPQPDGSDQSGQQAQAALSDDGAVHAGQDGDPICWVCGADASHVDVQAIRKPYACDDHAISPDHVPIEDADLQAAYTPPEGLDLHELDGWDKASVWDAFLSLGGQHSTCVTEMTGEVRNPDAWCAALKDEALGTDLWRKGSAIAPDDGLRRTQASAVYVEAATVQTTASLDEVADALQDAADEDLQELQSEDDYVAFSPGGAEPGDDGFSPWVIVDSGDGEYDTSGVPDDVVSDMEDALQSGDSGNSDGESAEALDQPRDSQGRFAELPGSGADQYVSPDAPELDPDDADSVEPLTTADDGQLGAAAKNMEVLDFGSHKGYLKHYRDDPDGDRINGEKPTLAEREVAADQFLRNLGHEDKVPGLLTDLDREVGGIAVSEALDGDHLRGGRPDGADQVDEDEFKDMLATFLLAGNSDMHGDNWVVREDGSFAAIDMNKSGGDFSSPSKFRRRGADMLVSQAQALGFDMDKQELQERAQRIAQDLDVDEAVQGVPNSSYSDAPRHQFNDNIRKNIVAFRSGKVEL